MKKIMYVLGLGLLASSFAGAACNGPFCYDDTGASIGGLGFDGYGNTVPTVSSITLNAITPRAIGQVAICNTCTTSSGSKGVTLCYSTATAVASYVLATATSTVCK